jgi:VanZ family protein
MAGKPRQCWTFAGKRRVSLQPVLRALAIGIVLAIWVLSLIPAPPAAPGGDKLHHFLAYFACMAVWAQLLPAPRARLKAMLGLCTMGVAIECLQGLSGWRAFEFADMVANALGAITAWLVTMVQFSLIRRLAAREP